MSKVVDYHTIIHSIECKIFEMEEFQKVELLAKILYPYEVYSSLTQTQLDKIRNILNTFDYENT